MPFLDEIAERLVSAGVGVRSKTIFLGSHAKIPDGDGPFISLIETGGMAPTRIHNVATAHTQRPTAQIMVRASKYNVARAKAKAAYDALDGIFNTTLSGTFYQKIVARQEPTDVGLDAKDRPMVVFNIEAEKQSS